MSRLVDYLFNTPERDLITIYRSCQKRLVVNSSCPIDSLTQCTPLGWGVVGGLVWAILETLFPHAHTVLFGVAQGKKHHIF